MFDWYLNQPTALLPLLATIWKCNPHRWSVLSPQWCSCWFPFWGLRRPARTACSPRCTPSAGTPETHFDPPGSSSACRRTETTAESLPSRVWCWGRRSGKKNVNVLIVDLFIHYFLFICCWTTVIIQTVDPVCSLLIKTREMCIFWVGVSESSDKFRRSRENIPNQPNTTSLCVCVCVCACVCVLAQQTHQASQFGMVSILVSCDILFLRLRLRLSSSFLKVRLTW